MRALNQLVRRRVQRGAVTVDGARYYAVDLEALDGVALDLVVRPDGRVFADFTAGQVALVRVA